jgi:hypothetical protein
MHVDVLKRKMYGNFTACALLTREPPQQAAEFRRRYGLECNGRSPRERYSKPSTVNIYSTLYSKPYTVT